MTDLEIWLIGTPDEVTLATEALALEGRPTQVSPITRLTGKDTGRVSRYLRLHYAGKTRRKDAQKPSTSTLFDSREEQ